MNAVVNATLRLGAILGAAFALHHTDPHTETHVSCHRMTLTACFDHLISNSLLPSTTHAVADALVGLLIAALVTLPLRYWQTFSGL